MGKSDKNIDIEEVSEEIFDEKDNADPGEDAGEVVFDDLPDNTESDLAFTEVDSQKQYINELESQLEEIGDLAARNLYQTIQVLGDIVSLNERRYFEGSHSRFVAQKSAEVATELGMSETKDFKIKTDGL